jgi:probable selenium-dependent hydroxylase accessory protein YqeC
MLVPPPEEKLYDRYYDTNSLCEALPPASVPGVTLVGHYNETIGKLESLPLPALSKLIPDYDLVLIEGDGSKGLPLKGWDNYEPVVPSFTTLTIGVLPLWPLGKRISEDLIFRLPLFLSLTGAGAGETLKPEHIRAVITSGSGKDDVPGLFAKAIGKKLLFFNQVEDDEALRQVREVTGLLPTAFRESLSGIIAGSVRLNEVSVIN